MSTRDRSLWPFKPGTSLVVTLLVLVGLLIILAIFKLNMDMPKPESYTVVLLGILVVSLLPVLLAVVDTVIERGGKVGYAGLIIDFSQTPRMEISGPTVPANIGLTGQPVFDSGSIAILGILQAMTSVMVIIDLEEGEAWWETRLLVLLAGAVRHNQPELIVFVGTYGGVKKRFQGWGLRAIFYHIF